MAEELVELTAAIQHELELARSGDGYEEAAVAGEIAERMVAPMLAARGAFFDQRLSDFREEYRKSLESWDRQRASLERLLAAAQLDVLERGKALDRAEASRQAWAEEAARLQQQRDEDEAPAPWDYPHEWRDNGGGDPYYNIKGNCRSCGRDYHDEIHDEPFGPPPVPPGPNAPCACLTEGVTLPAGWVRPQCAVHPEGQDAEPHWVRPVPECSTQNHAHYAHEVLLPDLSTVTCPGQGMSPSSSVHPEGGTA